MIVCVLTENEIAPLYRYVATSMNESIKSGKKFDPDKVMKRLYDKLSKTDSKDPADIKNAKYHAANFVQYVPALMIDLAMDQDYMNVIEPVKIGELFQLYTDFRSKDGLNIIIDKFTKKTNKNKIKAEVNTNKENKNKPVQKDPVAEETETEVIDDTRLKPFTSFKGTMQEYIAVDPKKKTVMKPQQIDKNRQNILNTLRSIQNEVVTNDDGSFTYEYQGEQLALRAMPLIKFSEEYNKYLDPTTKSDIARAAKIIAQRTQTAGVTQPSEQVVIVVTNRSGEVLFFDTEGNLTTEDSENAGVVYQFIHDVRKTKEGYTVKDIYNTEDRILSPEIIAEKSYVKELDGDYNTYLEKVKKDQQQEFKELYDFKEEVLNTGDKIIEFAGVSSGVSSDLNNKTIDFKLAASLGVTRKDFKTIETLKVAERGLSQGAAVITLNGRKFQVDRVNVPTDIVDQIVEVLFNKNITYNQRLNFLEQFIPVGDVLANSVRRHRYNYVKEREYINFVIYENTLNDKWKFSRDIEVGKVTEVAKAAGMTLTQYLKAQEQTGKYKFYIVDGGKTVKQYNNTNAGRGQVEEINLSQKNISTYTDAYITEAKTKIKDALLKGWKEVLSGNYFPTKVSFNETLLNDGEYLTYDVSTGKFVKKDYLDFIMSLDSKITIKGEDPGIYNNYINFSISTPESVKTMRRKETEEQITGDSIVRQKQKELVKAIKETPNKTLVAAVLSIDNVTTTPQGDQYTITAVAAGQGERYKIYRVLNKPTIGEAFDLVLEDVIVGNDVFPEAIKGKKIDDRGYVLDYGYVAATDFSINEEPVKPIPLDQYQASKTEIIKETTVPLAPTPEATKTNTSLALEDDWEGLERSGKFKKDNILTLRKKSKQAKNWWNNSESGKILSQFIELDHAANLVNSNVFADFVVAGATLMEDGKLGKIRINALKGSFVDVYHEAFHVFTQLFLTKEQKIKLYNEVKNYTDAKGNKPYAEMSYFEIEEMLAEDFRTYAKEQKPQKNTPVKNTLFRRMLNFLKELLGKIKNLLPVIKRDVVVDSSSVPVVGELFENLYFNNNNFLNNYKPQIENVAFNKLNRGITRVNSREQILSESDSNSVVQAIDSIISEEIDNLHDKRKTAGQSSLKSGVLGLITNDKNRSKLYTAAEEQLKEKLQFYKDQLEAQPGITKFSSLSSLEEIKANSIGVLKSTEGEPKYIFLTSQIDNFSNLIPDIKKGQRVKGDLYYDIRIVADFYRHASIKDGKKSVDIMVVSKPEDAEVQYDNYIKGKTKVYSGVELKENILPQQLNQEQEFILDNIRILETTLSEFGDPYYWQKGEEPKGLIKYHLENSAFGPIRETLVNVEFEDQNDYDDMLEDEEGNEVLPENDEAQSTNSELTNDAKVGKYSLLQLAEPRTIYILKSLFAKDQKDNFERDRFGFKKLANFKQTWNTVAKAVGGTQDPSKIYAKLLAASSTYPILKQLIEYKLPNGAQDITNSFEIDNLVSFWQTFRKPRVPYIQTIFYPVQGTTIDYSGREQTYTKGYTSRVVYASTDFAKVIRSFKNEFEKSERTPFVDKINNKSYLNLAAVVRNFRISKDLNELDTNKALEFARAVGFYMDDTVEIRKALADNTTFYGLQYIFNIVKDLAVIQANVENPDSKVPTEAIEFLNRFKANPLGTLARKMPSKFLPSLNAKKKDITEENVVNRLATLQANFGYAALNLGVRNAEGNTVFENIEVHSMYSQVDGLNQMSSLTDAWQNDEFEFMSYLDDSKNTFVRRSALLNSLFKIDIVGDSQFEAREGRSLEIAMDDGSKIAFTSEGTVSAELDKKGLFIQEMNNLLKDGFLSTIKLSDKKTTLGIRVKGGIIGDKTVRTYTDPYLYIDTDMFKPVPGQSSTLGERYAINNILLQHFAAEFDRIKRVKENREAVSKIVGPNRIVGKDKDGNDLMAAEVFTAFDNVLKRTTQEQIYDILPNVEGDVIEYLEANNPDLLKIIKNDIALYFRAQTEQNDLLFASKGFFVDEELEEKTGIAPIENPTEEAKAIRDTQVKKTLLRSYTYNAWIHNFEIATLFIGDLYQFKGEELHKRDSGATSGGKGFADAASIRNFINNHFNKGVYDAETGILLKPKTYAETLDFNEKTDKHNNFVFDGKLRTGVIADAERESVYLKEMTEAWTQDYIERGLSPKEAKVLAEKDADPYRNMIESDGAAFITIDAYRTLKKLENAWSEVQEDLYKRVIAGESLTVKDVKQFFPIYKLQNYGPLHDTIIPVVGMHKFAISPIVPNAVGQAELNKLQKEMLKKNIQYVLFGSGSKVSSLTATSSLTAGKSEFDNVFANDKQKSIKTGDDLVITPNIIYTRYLKNVTNVNDKYKKKVVDSTQQRAVITDGLYSEGEVKNPLHKQLLQDYNSSVGNYTNTLVAEVLNNIGFIYKDGKYVANKNSLEKFVKIIRDELGKKAIPEHLVKLLGVTKAGATVMDYSIHPEASTIEKIAIQILQKRIVNQKVKGEPLIQAPTTLTNGIWDTEFETLTDPEEIRKLLGSNNLPFYRRGAYDPKTKTYGLTHLAKGVIAMQGDFNNLYNLNDLEGNPIKDSADPLATLNALIKNDAWLDLDNNRLSITLMGPRIPNDAHNTIEGLEVWHFLDPSYGNTIIVPTEIVAKAGADFDVDKLTLAFPNLGSDGKYLDKPLSNKEFKELLNLAQENETKNKKDRNPNLPTVAALINRQKAALSNLTMKLRIDILKLPENYARLVKPNETHLVERYASDIASKKEFDKYKRMHDEGTESSTSPTRGLEIAYNLDKHEVNTGGGSVAVGIFAKNNKLHIINKQIGTALPKKYRSTVYVNSERKPGPELYDMIIRFPHNTMINEDGEEVISMSGEKTQKGTIISDINSHNLQGVLDRAKKSFPADLNITPENINMINTLINAGVDEELVFSFINQPLIIDYIRNIQNMSGIYGKITGVAPDSKNLVRFQAITQVLQDLVERNKKIEGILTAALTYGNEKSIEAVLSSLPKNQELAIPLDFEENEFKFITVGNLQKLLKKTPTEYKGIRKIYDKADKDIVYFKRVSSPTSEQVYYHVANWINDNYGSPEYDLADIKSKFNSQDNSSPGALALLLHYIQLEKSLRGHESSQMLFSPDTNYVKTVNQTRSNQKDIDELVESETIEKNLFEKFNKKAVVSSFRINQLITDTVNDILPLRLDKTISDKIDKYYLNVQSKFPGNDGKEVFSSIYNDSVINYIFQNNMSNFLNEKGEVVDFPTDRKGVEVVQTTDIDRAVVIKDKKIYVNPQIIESEFANKYYLNNPSLNISSKSYVSQGYFAFQLDKDPFKRPSVKNALPLSYKSNYVRFIIEREILRITNPLDKVQNDIMYLNLVATTENPYEAFLAKKALMNSFNPNYILGKAEFTYAEDVLDAMTRIDSNMKYQLPILSVLSEQSQIQTDDKIIQLNDTLDDVNSQEYYRNLVMLGDITIKKSTDADESGEVNKYITNVFKNFSLYMFYQHGIGYSRLGFSKALDTSSFTFVMKDAARIFLENLDSQDTALTQIFLEIESLDTNRNFNAYDPRYDRAKDPEFEEFIEDEEVDEQFLRDAFRDDDNLSNLSEYTNHSGGAYGGDTFWDIIGREYGVIDHRHYREASNANLSAQLRKVGVQATVLTKEQMDTARAEVERLLGKKYPDTTEGNLQVRNYYQVANADAVYAIAEITQVVDKDAPKNTTDITKSVNSYKHIVKGGTNTAVQLGIKLGKPVYVWDLATESWYKWDGNRWFEETTTPTLTKNFAGVGSRDIESYNVKNEKGEWVPRTQYKGKETEEAAKQAIRDVYENTINASAEVSVDAPVSQTNKPKGTQVKEGIYVNQGALTKEEQLELFDYLKPYLEEQAAKTNKGVNASKMIGLGLRWDYKNNNTGRKAIEIPDVINPGNKTKYGYYRESINGQPLGQITPRFRELMQKATGVDMKYYDGAIINLYEKDTFISSHNDVDESRSAIKYPVIGINLGGKGNFSIERLGSENAMLDLQAGTGYVFGVDGINREVWHRTFPTSQDSFLPELTTKIDGKTYPAGSYRITITMRRVLPLALGVPKAPSIVSEATQPTVSTILPGSETKINIYDGTRENAELSNFAFRPFTTSSITNAGKNITFNTVEGAFQAAKLGDTSDEELSWEEANAIEKQLQKATGPEAKAIGRKIKGLDTKAWDENSSQIMKDLLKESFEQNPDALAKLLATGNATLTHTQDKGKWGTEFPRLLMEVRDELRSAQPTVQPVGEVKPGVSEVFESNPELASIDAQIKKAYGLDFKAVPITSQAVGEPLSQTAATGICDYTSSLMEKRLKDSGMAHGTISIQDTYANYHAVAITEINGEKYLFDQPQNEFLTRGTRDEAVWENAIYYKGETERFNRHFPKIFSDITYAMGIPIIPAFFNKAVDEEYMSEYGPFFTNRQETIQGDKKIITAIMISDPKVKIRITLDADKSLEDSDIYLDELLIESTKEGETIVSWKNNVYKPRLIKATTESLMSEYLLSKDDADKSMKAIKNADIKAATKIAPIQSTTEPIENQIVYLEETLKGLEENKTDILENSVEGIVVSNLPKILPESARKETGLKAGTTKDINPSLLSAKGVTVERAAELIWEDFFVESGRNIDDYDLRNVIIEILQEGKSNYINKIVGQDQIDNTKKEIESLKNQLLSEKAGLTGTQLDLFGEETNVDKNNTPDGLPPIKRSNPNCGG